MDQSKHPVAGAGAGAVDNILPRERLLEPLPVDTAGAPVEPGVALPFDASAAPPTMLTPRELNYLHWLGAQTTGRGRVVELGCFLGGSTAALADGRACSVGSEPYTDAPMLVYDSFEAPGQSAVKSWWMESYGLEAGEDFLPRFRDAHAERWDSLDVRKGWIPGGLDGDALDEVYPEREPVELLFVDAAKTWETHVTILRAFASRMSPGGILVQQDFMDLLPWITVHMWELRECFEPLDLVRGTPTLSFRCIADPAPAIASLTPDRASFSQHEQGGVWGEIEAYWRGIAPDVFDGVLSSHAFLLALQAKRFSEALRHAEQYSAWEATAGSRHVYCTGFWEGWLERFEQTVASVEGDAQGVRDLRACHTARLMMPAREREHAGAIYLNSRYDAWERAAKTLNEQHARKIALYGAGRHTRWLLGADSPLVRGADAFEVVCVIDDAPVAPLIEGVPVLRPDQLGDRVASIDAVLPSSDAHERRILQRIREEFGGTDVAVVPLYTAATPAPTQDETPASSPSANAPSTPPRRPRAHELMALASHRVSLGLPAERGWLERFAESYDVPGWATGYVNHNDSLMLWDLIEAVRPAVTVEIGVASGVSSRVLACALRAFEVPSARLISVDLAERCYFDESYPVGAAMDTAPALVRDVVELFPGSSAVDACRRVRRASVEFAFIDGDHRHPAPVLDLIALLPALAPRAWVALHDIELPEIAKAYRNEFSGATGAHKLFHAWPYERVQPDHANPALNNIGAIRMPADPSDARRVLAELLREEWEIGKASAALDGVLGTAPTVRVRTGASSPVSG